MLQIITYPDSILIEPTEAVEQADLEFINKLLPELKQLCKNAKAHGIAANQVGFAKSFFIMDLSTMTQNPDNAPILCIINPIVKEAYEPITFEEGCLSLPGIIVKKERFNYVELEYKDENWNNQTVVFKGGEAVCALHETDHLNGQLLFDSLKPMAKIVYMRKALKYAKLRARSIYG